MEIAKEDSLITLHPFNDFKLIKGAKAKMYDDASEIPIVESTLLKNESTLNQFTIPSKDPI